MHSIACLYAIDAAFSRARVEAPDKGLLIGALVPGPPILCDAGAGSGLAFRDISPL